MACCTTVCDGAAATSYSEGLEAAYECYLGLGFCGTEEDVVLHPDAFDNVSAQALCDEDWLAKGGETGHSYGSSWKKKQQNAQ